jgi:hypothetical protein
VSEVTKRYPKERVAKTIAVIKRIIRSFVFFIGS